MNSRVDGFTCGIKTQLPKRKWKTVFLVLLVVSMNFNMIVSCSPRRLPNHTLLRDKKSMYFMIVYASASKRETQLGCFMQVQRRPKSQTEFGEVKTCDNSRLCDVCLFWTISHHLESNLTHLLLKMLCK